MKVKSRIASRWKTIAVPFEIARPPISAAFFKGLTGNKAGVPIGMVVSVRIAHQAIVAVAIKREQIIEARNKARAAGAPLTAATEVGL